MDTNQNLIRDKEVADMLGLSLTTLQHWRLEKKGPPYIRLGVNIRYSKKDVEAYIRARLVDPEGGAA